ncbi:hypothetical protein V6R21_17090 [Limibacter armeniacum]|uniref:hypothetical protein n=1 Tax=Limibacter armeniacum TaxID=466084 RepID=UPI002FE61B01
MKEATTILILSIITTLLSLLSNVMLPSVLGAGLVAGLIAGGIIVVEEMNKRKPALQPVPVKNNKQKGPERQ